MLAVRVPRRGGDRLVVALERQHALPALREDKSGRVGGGAGAKPPTLDKGHSEVQPDGPPFH